MDLVGNVQNFLSRWEQGGGLECRDTLTGPHSNPSDSDCNDILTTVYYTLLTGALRTWSPKSNLTLDSLISFIKSVLDHLPSSSSPAARSSSVTTFGELLVDLIWSVDAELEEVLTDARVAAVNAEQGTLPVVADDKESQGSTDPSALVAKVVKAKENAEADKESISVFVKNLLAEGIIDADVCRERLDVSLVASVGLISDKLAFEKKEIRTRTGLFYKQNKFNLLREQSEGYSKLTTELMSSLGPPHSPSTGLPVEPSSAIAARAGPAWQRVVALIGYFDLDPNRALDIILDVFSVNLTTHSSFFLAFLSFSSWSGSERHPRSSDEAMKVEPSPDQYRGKSLDEVLSMAEAQAGFQPLPSSSSTGSSNSRVLAQVLGFKFSHYQSQDAENIPRHLYLAAALLIREGFIALEDLYPHMTPTEEGMEDLHKKYLASIETRISGAKISQLAMAAPLESSTSSRSRPSVPVEPRKPVETNTEVPNQKLGLLHALLSVGALKPAIAVLTRYPWMVDAFPALSDLVIRVLKHSITPLYDSHVIPKDRMTSFMKPRARYGPTGVAPAIERRPQLTLTAPTPPCTNMVDFVFFYPQWSERIPLCSSLSDLMDVLEPLMRFIGLHVSRDPHFLNKFLRLGRQHLAPTSPIDPETKKPLSTPDPENPVRVFWFKALRLYLLPALPLIRGNAVCTVEVWNIVRHYDTTLRWRLYGEWKAHTYKSHPELRVRQVQAERESKGILRRLSHNTIDSLSGTVAKLAHSNPCIFFTNAVHQIMAYDNLAGVVIQALNYVTIMGFDVLLFVVLDALANPNKERLKDDGVNTSDWLISLASFTGMLFRRYSADISPLLKYIVHQLHNGQTTEIVVLRELIWKMAGIEPLPSLSDSQVVAMAGGPALRIEAVASSTRGARLTHGEAILKGPQRLGKALLDSELALPLLIQVAQQRQSCVFQAPNAHLKSLASLYDTTHGVLLQYLELLTSPTVIFPEDYATKIVPSLSELHDLYGISAPICMQIIRPMLHGALLTAALNLAEKERVASEEVEKRLKAALTAKREPSTTASRVASPSLGDQATSAESGPEHKIPIVDDSTPSEAAPMEVEVIGSSPVAEIPWLPELYPLFDEVQKIAPENAAEILGVGFYLTFWQLSTYDLSPPLAKYEEECTTLRALSRQEDSRYTAADRSSDRAKRATANLHREKRNRFNEFVQILTKEMKEQTVARSFTIKRLAREKQHWFAHKPKPNILALSFVAHCLQPRCLLSPMDADYCSQIIKVIHTQGTPGFSTLQCYDRLLGEHIKAVVFSCSEYEARNYGRFLLGILTDIWKWYQDEQLYMQDNRTKIGGKVVYLPGFRQRLSASSATTPTLDDILKWSDYSKVVKKWHSRMGQALIACIETGEFMHVYNAIIVLKEILPVFPVAAVNNTLGARLDIAISAFLEKEERGDLKILGKAYHASLKKRESYWAGPSIDKSLHPKTAGHSSSKSSSIAPAVPDKPRVNGTASPAPTASDNRRPPHAGAPSAPRAHQLNGASSALANERSTPTPSSTKLAMDSIPRPEVVKRVRPAMLGAADNSKAGGDVSPAVTPQTDAMDVDVASTSSRNPVANGASPRIRPSSPASVSNTIPALPRDVAQLKDLSRPVTPSPLSSSLSLKDLVQSPRSNGDEAKISRSEPVQDMPPPAIPSQTVSAQELRETAKQTRPSEKVEDKSSRTINDARVQAPTSSPRHRTSSPPSRPGTRNASADSRASGGRTRDPTRSGESETKGSERDSRQDTRESARRDGTSHRNERGSRSARDSDREKESDRERDRRDRHGDRHGDRERRDRDKERDRDNRDRDREKDRDKDRDRDRHRRDDNKDRERERKERGTTERGSNVPPSTSTPVPPDDRGLPARPDTSRHRSQHGDDTLGKRRRTADDDSERASKRPTRKESHHEDRSRRSSDKDKDTHDRTRDSDRRRKEREQPDADNKPLSIDTKVTEKRIPDGPASARALPPSTPSAPRAMSSSNDPSRSSKSEGSSGRDRDRGRREQAPRSPSNAANAPVPADQTSGGTLRSRIGDKELPRNVPQGPAAHRSEPSGAADRGRSEALTKDDDGDGGRKRTLSDREREAANGTAAIEKLQKRPKIDRNRYTGGSGVARRTLPLNPAKTQGDRQG